MPAGRLASLACFATAMVLCCQSANGEAKRQQQLLLGCWEVTSPFPRDQIPEGDEWGWAKWCFDKGRRIRTWTVACPRFAGCDGGDGENAYRWHEDHLEIPFLDTDDKNPTYMGWVWRPRAVNFPTKEKMLMKNCPLWTSGEWVRVRDPDKGNPASQRR